MGIPLLSSEAQMVLGLAGTAIPFAGSPEEEAERWLRIMRLHGNVSPVLQASGIGEVPVVATDGAARTEAAERAAAAEGRRGPRDDGEKVVKRISNIATRHARQREARAIETFDVLIGVMEYYGEDFDSILRAYGTDRSAIMERLRDGERPEELSL